jgi:hypothetical protein
MTKDLVRSPSESLKMLLQIREQQLKRAAMMIMRDHPSRDAPEPFNAVGVGIIGRGIHQAQMLAQFGKHAAHEQGPSRGMRLEVVGNHDSHSSSLFGTSHSGTDLLAEDISRASWSDPSIEPASTPVQQAKAIDFSIIPRCLDQTLPASSFSRPEARKSWMKSHLHLIWQIEISTRYKCEQVFQVGGKLIPQVSLHQIMNG